MMMMGSGMPIAQSKRERMNSPGPQAAKGVKALDLGSITFNSGPGSGSYRQSQEAPELLHRDHVQLDGGFDLLDQAGILALPPALMGEIEQMLQGAGDGRVGTAGKPPSRRLHPRGELIVGILLRHHTMRPNQSTDRDADTSVINNAAATKNAVISRVSVSFCSLVLRSL